jgi:hypothetical protein
VSRPDPDPRRQAMERMQALAKGDKGDRGEQGPRGLSMLQGRAVVFLFLVAVALSVFAIFWVSHSTNRSHADQARQGQVIEHRLCATLGALAALQPPAGDPAKNPARAYDQQLHATLAQLGPDLGCRR